MSRWSLRDRRRITTHSRTPLSVIVRRGRRRGRYRNCRHCRGRRIGGSGNGGEIRAKTAAEMLGGGSGGVGGGEDGGAEGALELDSFREVGAGVADDKGL